MSAAYDLLCSLVLEDGSLWGESAADFQREDAKAILDGEDLQHWLTRPRGGRKTTDLAGIIIAILLRQAPPHARCYSGASDEDQAAEVVDAARGLIERTPELERALIIGELKITNPANGAAFEALPGDGSAMGKRPYLLLLDEVANWPETKKARRFWGVMTSANRKVPTCRLVVITNAGVPEHWAYKRREQAVKSAHWHVHEVPGPLPWLTDRDIEILRENAETESEFQRLHLNEWVASEDALASRADIDACAVLREPLERREGWQYIIGVDMATKADNAVAAVMHIEYPGTWRDPLTWQFCKRQRRALVLDRLQVWKPSRGIPVSHSEVESWLISTALQYNRALIHYDPAQLYGMVQTLQMRGVRCEPYTFSYASVGRLGVLLHQLIRDHEIELQNDEELLNELAHVRLRRTAPGQFRLDHDSGGHDDRAVAIALAALPLVEPPKQLNEQRQIVRGPRWGGNRLGHRGGLGVLEREVLSTGDPAIIREYGLDKPQISGGRWWR